MSDPSARLGTLSREEKAALAQLLRKRKEGPAPPAPPPPEERREHPLSFAQQRLWFLDRVAPGSPFYNVFGGLRIVGRLDAGAMAASLTEIVRRHAVLRSRFEIRDQGPVQIVEPPQPFSPIPLPVIDLSALPATSRSVEETQVARAVYHTPFDLRRPPLLRARLLRLGPDEHLLVYTFHHIASDAWSSDVAVREVGALYPAFCAGRPSPLPELPLQYADFAREQAETLRGETLLREIGFWRERLAGAAALELPLDHPRPALPTFRGGDHLRELPPALEAGLRRLIPRERATLFMALLAPLGALFSRLTATGDVVIGTTVSGRNRPDVAGLIGFFVNTLVLRVDLSGDPDGREILARTRQAALDAFAHQAVPFEKLVDELALPRDPYRPPLLRVLFQLLPAGTTGDGDPGFTLRPYRLPGDMAKLDLVINVIELDDRHVIDWVFDADLLDESTVERWAGAFETLLEAWLEDPGRRLSELPLLTEAQRRDLLALGSPESIHFERRALPALFEAQVDRTPDAPAVSGELTYRELDARANRLARWLVDAGVVPGDRVALCLDRSPDLVVSLLAVLKTGAAYVPLDPASPRERLASTLEDSGARVVLTEALLSREREAIARRRSDRLGLDLDPELPAYVIYTSGSTGRPKGVIVPHGAVSRLFAATARWFAFSSGDVWTLFHSSAFDFSVWEIWGALLHGGRLVVVPWEVSRDPEAFLRLLCEERVTVLNQTPSAFRQLPAPAETLRWVIFGGEALDPTSLASWFSRHGDQRPRLVNMYGITETTVHVTYRPLTRDDAARPASLIGRPIPDLALHVVDPHLQLQPLGVPGEICVGGAGLAQGYLGRPDLTAARFVPDPFGEAGARLYRSGDLARRRPDGELEYLGRIDHQVKIRGFRIELGEIEAAIAAHPAVREAVVLARTDGTTGPAGERRPVAYVTAAAEAPSFAELREFLASRLPEPMLPAALIVLDRLPLTVNGKVDRRALPAPEAAPAAASGRAHVPPRDALETSLAGLFRRVLNVPAEREIGVLDSFFELGGTSISGAVLINLLQEMLGEIVHVVVIFDHPTVESLAAYVREQHATAAVAEPPPGPADVAEMLRLIVEGREPSPPNPLSHPHSRPPGRGGTAVFVLSPPRSGSTLLRVMLGAHPRLFAPPELELLSFETLAGRHAAFSGRDSFWLEGVIRAVMEARSCDAAEAERIVAAGEREGWTTRRFYGELQGWIGDRLLVDKTPSYALDPAVLRRAESWFMGARYLHLVRHPQATLRSFTEARLDQIFFRRPHRFSRRRLAELIWTVSHRNILDFLAEVPAERRHTVRFEELVRDPQRVLSAICDFLGLDLDPAMVDPYRGGARMTGGVHAVSRMLGDVKFLAHGKVDASVAERWREAGELPLGGPARAVAAELGFVPPAGSAWEEGGTAPLSFAQERLWFLEQLVPGTPTYNVPVALRLRGRLEVPALTRVFHEIVRRHAALRTVFASEGGQPIQKIQPVDPSRSRPLPVIDLSALAEGVRDAEVLGCAAAEATRPFDLERGPLFRASLLHLGPREHVALSTMHHIVSDGWSVDVFYREVTTLYQAFVAGRPSPLPELRLQYPDFALRQRGRLGEERLIRDLEWWKARLAGLEPLELPTDRPRPAVRSGRGAVTKIVFGPELPARLTALGRRERATLYMVLLAAFQGFLYRLTGQTDIAVGSPVANRTTRDVEELIGFFVNTLVMRTGVGGDPAFRELLARVRGTALDALLHQETPFEQVVEAVQPERQLSRTPLFQVLFSLQTPPGGSIELPGLRLEWVETLTVTSKFDLSVLFGETPGELGAVLEHDLDLFDPATAERLARLLGNLLRAAVASPEAPLSTLPLLDPAEREQIVRAWNRTTVPIPRHLPVHRLIEEQVDRAPGAVAITGEDEELTYAQLDRAANRLAHRLRRLGAGPEVPVAVLAERSPELIVALLAVMKSGGFFVPLDATHPPERLTSLIRRSGARLAVTRERFLDRLPEGTRGVCLDRDREAIAAEPASRLAGGATAQNLVYVIFTSGSTGEPKGVAVTHGNVVRLVRGTGLVDQGPGATMLMLTPVSFDVSTFELWGPLANGGRIAVFPPHTPGLDELAGFLERRGVTGVATTAALFHQMAEHRPDSFAPLSHLVVGGEVLSPVLARRVIDALPGLGLWNAYGPTESTTIATACLLTREEASRPSLAIGLPIANTTAHVLEPGPPPNHPAPVGVWGELYLGGEGLARGYLGRPDLTAERFVPDPFGGERLYRTGDLARRRPDGVLEFLGRADRQVKIRGFRIEPAEVEAALTAHPEVAEAAILVRGEETDKHLVAYVVLAEGSEVDLHGWLAGRLPDFMVPSAFVILPRLPLTPNGKVDRKELAKIAPERPAVGYVAPRTPVEEALAGIFLQVLGEERTGGRVGIHDHFFALGGHSLAAARLVSRVHAVLGVELPLRALFEAPTVAGLAERCGDPAAAVPLEPLRAAPRDPAGESLSFAQERLWFLERLTPGTSTYNLPSHARLRGPLDPARLARCFGELRRRHEVLRTRFVLRGDTPVQIVDPPAPFVLPIVDLSGLTGEVSGREAERRSAEETDQPFDLERGPLLRAVLLCLGAEEHALLLTLHHIVTDGWSLGILLRELAAAYQALQLPELPVQVADVAHWQRERLRGPALEAQLAWWRERLDGAPAALDLPLDRARPAVQSFRGAAIPWLLPADLSDRLRALANREGASLFMVLLAGLDLLLARWSGQDDVLVGSPVAGRGRPELEELIGLFLNNLVLRVDLTGRPAGRTLLERAREAALGAYAHQEIPFEKLLQELQPERDLSRTPLFQVFLNMLNFPGGGSRLPDGLVLEPLGGTGADAKFDLTIYAAEADSGVALNLVYNADLFDRARMEELLRQLASVLAQLAAAPDATVDTISLLTPEAAAQLPDPHAPLGDAWAGPVHALFGGQARLHPDRPAVSDAGVAWTYGELAEAVARLAARLRDDGLAPGEPVAIWAERSAHVAWAMMATAWAGGAFVMLDPAYPPARLAEIVELAAPCAWIQIGAEGALPSGVEESLRRLAARGRLRCRVSLPVAVDALPPPVEPAAVGPDDLACIAFTSGSTGTPKGIEGRHGPLSHFLPFLQERFGLTGEDRYSLLSGLSHDPLQRDVFTPLCLGASLCAPAADEIAPGRLAAWMARERITVAHLTPAMAQLLTEGSSPAIPTLRLVLLVGDVLTRLDVERLRRIAPRVTCVNLYGSTETQRSVAFHVVEEREIDDPRAPQVLPLGRGMRDVQLLVVGRSEPPRLAGIGEVGEIWMRSPHLARGYLGDPALTAERFRVHPFTRSYRTGDLGRYRPDGEATFAGRADQQVKIRGFRIELGEIEAALGRLPGVREAVVLAATGPADRYLVGYVAGEGLDPEALRAALQSRLPGYMVPAAFVVLDRLPLTPNGKVDRRALSRLTPERGRVEPIAPRTPTEEALAALWVELLGPERTGGRVGVHDNFFALGGHSLLATRLVVALRDVLGVELPLRAVFEHPVLEEMARRVEEAERAEAFSEIEEDGPVPLSFAQERLWFLDQMAPGSSAYNMAGALRLRGTLDVEVLRRSIREIVRRHEVLRTTFPAVAGQPVQQIEPFDPALPVARTPLVDLSALPEPVRNTEARELGASEADRPFDLAACPLLRVVLLLLGPVEHVVLFTMHHIVSDGWSMGVFHGEVGALYQAFSAGRPSPLPELPLQYAGHARRQRARLEGPALQRGLAAWRRRLEGVEPLELPADRPRPAARSWRGAALPLTLGAASTQALNTLARSEQATLFMGLLALLQVFLHRLSRQDDIAVGTAVANRDERAVEGLIGFFVNSLVLRTDLSGDPPVREAVRRARRTALEAFQLQEIPFEKVVEAVQPERHTSRSPLFQAILTLQNVPSPALPVGGLVLEPVASPKSSAKLDLALSLAETPSGLSGSLEYDLDLFDPETAERLVRHFVTLIEAAVETPERRISEVPLLTPPEREQIVRAWNRTAVPIPRHLPVHRLFEEQVDRAPQAVAVTSDEEWTYADLDAASNRLAHRLRRLGSGPEVPVLVLAERSPGLVAALLAVMKSGGFFVPLDPGYPAERLAASADLAGACLAVTQERFLDRLPAEITAVCLDRDREAIAAEPSTRLADGAEPGNLLYVMFTSGSTGEPKGVAITHQNVVRLVRGTDFAGLGPGETFLMFAPVSFDLSTLELWGPLANGGRIAIFPPHTPSLDELGDFLMRSGVTQLWLTAGLFHQMVDERLESFAGLRRLLAGGDALSPAHVRKLLAARLGLVLVDGYGPTESTTFATCQELTSPDQVGATVPIGLPIANTTVHVLEPGLEPAPVGVWGELCIGGEGVGRGYLGRPDLTAERFMPDPFGGDRLYRTGDLARRRPDGVLEFLGRMDRQVKIRGFRVEPAEVEAVLATHPAVREVSVLVRGEGADKRLVAYVVGEEDGPALRRWLADRLPEPMVPSGVVVLPRLPLTANGKVDRRALTQIAPERTAGDAHVAPRTPVEETLANLFIEVLGAERTGGRVGVHDSFFELGGHSLLGTRLIAALHEAFRVELPLRVLFERPTVEGLAAAVAEAAEEGAPVDEPVVPVPRQPGVNRFPVSFSQLREWILDRLEPGNPAYNIPNHLRIGGPLSLPVLTEAFNRLAARHEVFRTCFEAGDEEPLQAVLPEVRLEIPVIDLSALPDEARESELWRRVRQEAGTGFDLATAPLLRARIVRLGPEDHALLMTVHHIIADGWSMGILNRELAALYEAALPPLPVQYADYAVWQRKRGEALERQAGYWRQRLAGAPALLELPTDRPRPPVRSSRGTKVPFLLPQPLAGRLEELARRRGATLFMVLLAGYQSLLARWSGQEDVVVGTYSGNRPRRELEGLIGFFINTLVLRTDLAGDPSFAGVVGRVRETTLGAYAHRDLPFEKLLEILQLPRDPSRTPLFQALLVLQNFPPANADLSTGVRLAPLPVGAEKADYDLALWLGEGPEGIGGALEYSTDLFDEATIHRFAAHLRTLLEAAVAEPNQNVWTLPLISEEEQQRHLAAWSRGPAVPEGSPLLHRLVEEQAARTPDAVALEAGSVRFTYAGLVERASRAARVLREQGIGPGAIVALAAERTPELIVDMLAVLQAGAAYLPIDPAYPQERQSFMVADSGAVFLGGSPLSRGQECAMGEGGQGGEAAAYLIYTSGSTGRPKGVVVPHRAIASFVRSARETYGIAPGDRVLQLASISFDTSAEEIWPALAAGATLVLRPEEMAASIPHFLRELERLDITVLDLPTAYWHEMVVGMEAEALELPRGLRLVIIGGEEALADRFALWQRRADPSVRLVNTYGPTETTIVATRRELSDLAPGGTVPIGRPIPGARAYVLDRFLAPLPPGVRGELWIGGAGVALGYLGRPDLTAERFRPDPFVEGARLYRTGDLAVLRADGDLLFAGRADRQLKVRGYRIEPGEIEAALRLHPAVHDAVADVRGPRDLQRLIAWIVPREETSAPEASDLRAFLRDRLPEPLLPAAFVSLTALPLTPNGKVDRRLLSEPTGARPEGAARAEPRSALERTIAEVYRELLRVDRIGLHDNFFDLGGHSLLIVRAHQRLKEALGKEIPVLDLFRFPTVAALARHLGGEETGSLRKVQGLAVQQRAAQQRQKAAMERLRRPGASPSPGGRGGDGRGGSRG